MDSRKDLRRALNGMHLQWFADGDDDDVTVAKRFIETEDGGTWFKEAATALGYMTSDEVEEDKKGVATKNQELITKNKKLQKSVEDSESTVESFVKLKGILKGHEIIVDVDAEIDYDTIDDALSRSRRDGGDGNSGDLEELKRQVRKSQRDLDDADRKVTVLETSGEEKDTTIVERNSTISSLLIDGAFQTALIAESYSELTIPLIVKSLREKSKAEVQKDEETGEYKAVTDDGRSIPDWVKFWKDTDEGKALRPGAINTGGGGKGSGGKGGGTVKPWAEMTGAEKTQLHIDNPEVYRAKRDEARKPA